MNKQELTNYIFNFWENWGAFNYDERDDNTIVNKISHNLTTLKGIEKELDYIRNEFENGWEENSLEYNNLCNLWNELNYYKTKLQKESNQ